MAHPLAGLNYTTCTVPELRKFIISRTNNTPQRLPKRKAALVKVLRNLDKTATFDNFLSIPPELREYVYGYALTPEKDDNGEEKDLDLSLLRVSKQVYKEAYKVLHETAEFEIDAIFVQHYEYGRGRELQSLARIRMDAGENFYPDDQSTVADSLKGLKNLPPMRNMRLLLALHDGKAVDGEQWPMAAKFLEALVQSSPKLKKLALVCRHWKAGTEKATVETLRPLKELPSICEVDLQEWNEGVEKAFWEMVKEDDKAKI